MLARCAPPPGGEPVRKVEGLLGPATGDGRVSTVIAGALAGGRTAVNDCDLPARESDECAEVEVDAVDAVADVLLPRLDCGEDGTGIAGEGARLPDCAVGGGADSNE